jgi:hypothetical protein
MVLRPAINVVAPPRADALGLDRALALGAWLVMRAQPALLARSLTDLGEIDLPPTLGSADDQSRLRAVPPLYLAAELEQARLLPAVELLAGLYVSGGLPVDAGDAGPQIVAFWKDRHQRLAERERRALFSRLFGGDDGPTLAVRGGVNEAFTGAMIGFTEALHRLQPAPQLDPQALPASGVPFQLAARQLADNLLPRAGGMAVFAAGDLVQTLGRAIDLLKQPALQSAVGARGVWNTLRNVARDYLEDDPPIEAHISRGKAGMIVLTWLAENLLVLDQLNAPTIAPGHPVIAAATAWLQTSLYLEERHGAADPPGRRPQ